VPAGLLVRTVFPFVFFSFSAFSKYESPIRGRGEREI